MPAEAKRGFPIFLLISASCYAQEAKAIRVTNRAPQTIFRARFGGGMRVRCRVGSI